MKKIMISLLMVAATLNAMAVTYSGKVKVKLTSSDSKYCEAVVATSNDFSDGLNNGYYAAFNDENKDVHLYVDYEGTSYAHFGSSATTMRNMPLIMKANSATSYSLSFSAMVGTIDIYDKKLGVHIDKSQNYDFTIEASERDANDIVADRFIINYTPYEVTTNAYGLATFSYASNLEAVEAGVKLYKGAFNGYNETLGLTQVNYVKAGEGVIVYGEANTTYHFNAGTGDSDFASNSLLPSSEWENRGAGQIYVLSGNLLYLYEGTTFPANKAYLELPANSPAPARIRLVFNQTTAMENVEAENVKAEKFVENGQIFIRRGNEVYNLQGQKQR